MKKLLAFLIVSIVLIGASFAAIQPLAPLKVNVLYPTPAGNVPVAAGIQVFPVNNPGMAKRYWAADGKFILKANGSLDYSVTAWKVEETTGFIDQKEFELFMKTISMGGYYKASTKVRPPKTVNLILKYIPQQR